MRHHHLLQQRCASGSTSTYRSKGARRRANSRYSETRRGGGFEERGGKLINSLHLLVGSGKICCISTRERDRTLARSSATVPILFVYGGDPVKDGLVASFNRPGGNVTGVTFLGGLVGGRRVQLLHDLAPQAGVIALLRIQKGELSIMGATHSYVLQRAFTFTFEDMRRHAVETWGFARHR